MCQLFVLGWPQAWEQYFWPVVLKIRDLLFSAPNDFPRQVLDEFKQLAQFADDQNLNETENKQKVFEAVYNLINTISPFK